MFSLISFQFSLKVILLTAIEYAREETEEHPADDAISSSTPFESADPKEAIAALETGGQAWAEKETQTKVESGPWVCGLRKLGELFTTLRSKLQLDFSEAKILPICVLLLCGVYTGYAASLYF